MGRGLFGCPVGDIYCGLRGFTKNAYVKMGLQATGMEFATEMVIKSSILGLKIAEVPIVLHPDGRSRAPHLRTWRDGWRTVRLMVDLARNGALPAQQAPKSFDEQNFGDETTLGNGGDGCLRDSITSTQNPTARWMSPGVGTVQKKARRATRSADIAPEPNPFHDEP